MRNIHQILTKIPETFYIVRKTLRIVAFYSLLSGLALTKSFAQDSTTVTGPEEKPIYYETLGNGLTRFYFDQYYFLSDKFCPFISIERDAGFDFTSNSFEGEFTDYDQYGRIVLTGTYRQGLKHGIFKAFHGNGQLKWERTYVDDLPEGEATYFYPDGKPMITVWHGERGIEIRDYWNQTGSQRVVHGRGRYEMRVETDGYNEYGASFIMRKGKIRDGQPQGLWLVGLVYPDQSIDYLETERYQNGRFVGTRDPELESLLQGGGSTSLLPVDWFVRAEALISKKCTIDEHVGFTRYLEQHLENWFKDEVITDVNPQRLGFKVYVHQNGTPIEAEAMLETFKDMLFIRNLLHALRAVHWVPSWSGDEYIADTLEVSFEVFPDPDHAAVRFFDVQISRERGN